VAIDTSRTAPYTTLSPLPTPDGWTNAASQLNGDTVTITYTLPVNGTCLAIGSTSFTLKLEAAVPGLVVLRVTAVSSQVRSACVIAMVS
jgi:hypothetical protein